MKKAKSMFNLLFKIIKLEEMRILPGQLAFFFVLSIFAIFPLLGFISSSFITQGLINSIEENLPTAVSTILKSLMDTKWIKYYCFCDMLNLYCIQRVWSNDYN